MAARASKSISVRPEVYKRIEHEARRNMMSVKAYVERRLRSAIIDTEPSPFRNIR